MDDAVGQISEDGLWQWDGQQWVPREPGPATAGVSPKRSRSEAKAAKAEQVAADEAARAAQAELLDLARSPAGRARLAYERGDFVFQCSFDMQALVLTFMGVQKAKSSSDPAEILNAVCSEGWEVVSGSFVFVEEGSQSRDKVLLSGQHVAIKGRTVGYYLFRRNPDLVTRAEGVADLLDEALRMAEDEPA